MMSEKEGRLVKALEWIEAETRVFCESCRREARPNKDWVLALGVNTEARRALDRAKGVTSDEHGG
jgi:hypothetical protein